MPVTTLYNGQEIEPGLSADRAFHFGDGVFETIAVVDGHPCLWNRHMQRLINGCECLGLPLPDLGLLRAAADRLVRCKPRAVLKVILSSGTGGHGYGRPDSIQETCWLQIKPWPESSHYAASASLKVQWCELQLASQPRLAGIKHLNRLEQVLARRELSSDVQEGLVCDQAGNVIEGISSNLLLKIDDRYVTPALKTCGVAGVVRGLVLDLAANDKVSVEVGNVSRTEVARAERVFLCNSLMGIKPVKQVGEIVYPDAGIEDEFLRKAHDMCFSLEGDL